MLSVRTDLYAVLVHLLLYMVLRLDSALSSLPAPINVCVISTNFHHVLQWEPGVGTLSGTQYQISKKVAGKKWKLLPKLTNATKIELKLEYSKKYDLAVQSSYNATLSQLSKVTFCPYTDTLIGPPEVSVKGCGTCLQINVSLPTLHLSEKLKIRAMHKIYDPEFEVFWRKGGKGQNEELKTHNSTIVLSNLEKDVEYCVQVHIRTRANQNTKPSTWTCMFTSTPGLSQDFIVGAVTGVLIAVLILLMMVFFCLYYTGFLCKLEETKPGALVTHLIHNYILTPDKTPSDWISSISDLNNQRKQYHPTIPIPAGRDGDLSEEDSSEEEEDQMKVYMDRDAEFSGTETSHQDFNCVNSSQAVTEDSGSSMERVTEPQDGPLHDSAEAQGSQLLVIQNNSHTRVQEQFSSEEEEEEEMKDVCRNVNLFSVTLLSLAGGTEGEEEEEKSGVSDCLNCSTTDSVSEHDHWTTRSKMTNMPSENISEMALTFRKEEEEEEEEEEEFSSYLENRG